MDRLYNLKDHEEVHTGFWWEIDHLEDSRVDGRIILRWIFRKWEGETWTGMMWLRVGTGGWLL